MRRIVVMVIVAASLLPALRAQAATRRDTGSPAGTTNRQADYNGDGFADLAIGVPSEGGDTIARGGVNVIYGSAAGLSATTVPDQFWTQDSPGVEGTAENFDSFGFALASADFNGDGFTDLAVGVPNEDFAASNDGGVNVIYGTAFGLSATLVADQFWSQDSAGINGGAEDGDDFGHALAAGDFNDDGFFDLAVGVLLEDVVVAGDDAGAVNVIYGSAGGLSATAVPDQLWSQDSADIAGKPGPSEHFGSALAVGDFNGFFDDLAIGVPGDSPGGGVNVIYGSASGLSATAFPDQRWTQDSASINGTSESGDSFGLALAAANFGGSIEDDLAVGVPGENVGGGADGAGGVNVIYGSATGLSATSTPDQFWSQDSSGIFGTAEPNDQFGDALAAADFGGSVEADLAVGVPREDFDALDDGGVNVIYGSAAGLSATATPDQFWSQSSTGIEGTPADVETFGTALAAANFGGSTQADLAIGVPGEDAGFDTNAGAINVIYGSTSGLSATATADQFWNQDSTDIESDTKVDETFGDALSAGG